VNIDEEAVDALLAISAGDLRRSITLLQGFSGMAQVTLADVNEASGYFLI
jgi:DNA polymerase III delta prime subunit